MKWYAVIAILILATTGSIALGSREYAPATEAEVETFNAELVKLYDDIYGSLPRYEWQVDSSELLTRIHIKLGAAKALRFRLGFQNTAKSPSIIDGIVRAHDSSTHRLPPFVGFAWVRYLPSPRRVLEFDTQYKCECSLSGLPALQACNLR